MNWLQTMRWVGTSCLIMGMFCLINLRYPLDVGVSDGCDSICPCDEPSFESLIIAASDCETSETGTCPSGDACGNNLSMLESPHFETPLLAMGEQAPEDDSTSVPCSSDCADCACNASQTMARLAPFEFPLTHRDVDAQVGEWIPLFSKGALNSIFHPPRSVCA